MTHTEIVVSPEDDVELRASAYYQPVTKRSDRLSLPVMLK